MLKFKTQKNLNKGFTLVELIVVIAIIAVLSVVAVVAYSNISDQAEKAAIRSDANTVIRALNTYNSLTATTKITTKEGITAPSLQGLSLSVTSGDSVDMHLGVTITDERLGAVKDAIKFDGTGDSAIWALDESALGTGGSGGSGDAGGTGEST